MQIPTNSEIDQNLRQALVVKAEELLLMAGGEVGSALAEAMTGAKLDGELPSDFFVDDAQFNAINIEKLEIRSHFESLRTLLVNRSLAADASYGSIDSDHIEQEHLEFIELFLSSLPNIALGGRDWTGCRNGPIRDLLSLGRAWHRLTCVIDDGTNGDFDLEWLTATDLALIAGIEVRSIRNMVGPNKMLRSFEKYQKRKTDLGSRGFAAINRFDALTWLNERKGFHFADMKQGFWANRLEKVEDEMSRGRAALLAWLAMNNPRQHLAVTLGVDDDHLRDLGDGQATLTFAQSVFSFVINFDLERPSRTAPA